jgi:RNA polymerase sigma factor (sigma-70 family)
VAAPNQGDDIRTLVSRCNRGDKQAWEEFYAMYFNMVSAAVKRISRSEPDETEDTVQEVFIHLFKALKHYDPARSLEAYILEIARRVRISRYRYGAAAKRGGANPHPRNVNAHDSADGEQYVSIRSSNPNQEMQMIQAEEARMLRKALGLISEGCRELLRLRYDQGLSYQEVGEILRAKEGSLRVRVQRCLAALGRSYSRVSSGEVVRKW